MKADTAIQSDIDALTALNSDYIRSVQHYDVQRFDEILAEDFVCSNPRRVACRQEPIPCSDRATGDNQRPLGGGCASSHSRRYRDHSRAHQLHHRRRRAAEWPVHRCVGAPERKVACCIRARDAISVFPSNSFRPANTLAASVPGGARARLVPESRLTYFCGGTLSGIAAPQASASSRKADCQFRATISCAQFRNCVPSKYAPARSAPSSVALKNFAPSRWAPDRSASQSIVPLRSAPRRSARERSNPLKTRTLDKVRTEMSLHVLAYNLKRMITIFGVGPLMAAIRT